MSRHHIENRDVAIPFVGDFTHFLLQNDGFKTYTKLELKDVYERWKVSRHCKPAPFSTVLEVMEFFFRQIRTDGDLVLFRGTADFEHIGKKRRLPKVKKGTPYAKFKDLVEQTWMSSKTCEKMILGCKDVKVTTVPDELEKIIGYYIMEVETKKEFLMRFKNVGTTQVVMLACFLWKNDQIVKLNDKNKTTCPNGPNPVLISPGGCHEVRVTVDFCKFQPGNIDVGLYACFLTSDDVQHVMMRTLKVRQPVSQLEKDLQASSPFQPLLRTLVPSYTILSAEPPEGKKGVNNLQSPSLKKYPISQAIRKLVRSSNKLSKQNGGGTQELLKSDLDFKNYKAKFKLLLNLEELQAEQDIRHYDIGNTQVQKQGSRFLLKVPGLAEKRPSVLRGDRIYLQILDKNGVNSLKTDYEGFVEEIQADCVKLKVHDGFSRNHVKGVKISVRFQFNRLSIQLQQRFLDFAENMPERYKHLLFPQYITEKSESTHPDLNLYNRALEKNSEQRKAVSWILNGVSNAPYIIYGPPGTGKTVTVVEAIKQLVREKGARVLVTTPSNSSCDLIVQRLLEHIGKSDVLRMNAASRNWIEIPNEVQAVSNYYPQSGEFYYPTPERLIQYKIVACTLVTSGRLSDVKVLQDHFDYVIVDEAGQSVEPECLIAVGKVLKPSGRLILAGDPRQLGPVLRSTVAKSFGLNRSYLERLMDTIKIYQRRDSSVTEKGPYDARVISKLVQNYRSHGEIIKIPNECFYDGELMVCADPIMRNSLCGWEGLPTANYPFIFHGIYGKDSREGSSPSYFNVQEITQIVEYVRQLLDCKRNPVKAKEIGIISPYRKQVVKIRKALEKTFPRLMKDDLKVGSVEEFQGQERRVIIVSTVRSNPDHLLFDAKYQLGFLKNPKRFNVTVTRAKSLLIVIGNPKILHPDPHWRKLLERAIEMGGYRGVQFELPVEEEADASDSLVVDMKLLKVEDGDDINYKAILAELEPQRND